MNAIILGAGRIGRGFVTELLTLNHVNITFFDAMPAMVDSLNEQKEYTIHVLGAPEKDLLKKDVVAYPTSNTDKLAECWADADFIFTACGGKNMKAVGATLAEAFKKVLAAGNVHTSNIVTCENWIDPATELKNGILENLSEEERKVFEENTGVSESVILCTGTGAPDPSKVTNPMDTWVQDLRYLPIDRDRIKGELPNLEYVEFVPAFGDLLKQKIYTNNTSVATVAYLGKLKGLTYVADGDITSDEYMMKLDRFVSSRTEGVKGLNNQYQLRTCYDRIAPFYKNEKQTTKYAKSGRAKSGTKTSAKSGSKSSGRKSTKTANRYNKKD